MNQAPPQSSVAAGTLILRVAVPSPLRRSFDYLPPTSLSAEQLSTLRPGIRVLVPFGRREVTAVLLELANNTEVTADKMKEAIAVLDEAPLFSEQLMDLFLWAAAYYQHPVGDVFSTLLPALLRQGKPATVKRRKKQSDQALASAAARERDYALALNQEQSAAASAIISAIGSFQCFLLDGVTGSGKTEVYLQTIAEVIKAGWQALVLVPEISLTPQTINRFSQRFDCRIAVMHSGLTPRERLNAWLDAASGEADIVIGTRSAIFTPLARPGILIIDEEHDGSFKQQDGFRYSARDLGIMRGHREGMPVVLGSATPSLESLQNALSGRYAHLRLHSRAGAATSPVYRLLDTNGVPLEAGITEEALQLIDSHLQRQGQVLVFINRRGFSPTLQCQDCGWVAECRRCDARLTLHRQPPHLRCHHCEARSQVPAACPQCAGRLSALGTGTERSESLLGERFPKTRVIRVDRDTTRRRNELDQLLAEVHSGVPCILTGTQMLAKGHHFPAVTLVVVLDADGGLFSADFRGQEHMAQLLVQVAGRSGRAEAPGEVVIQTRHSTHEMLQVLIRDGYSTFAEALLREREASSMPPFTHLALLRAEAGNLQNPERFLNVVRGLASLLIRQHGLNRGANTPSLLGPLPAPMEKRAGKFRAQLLIQAPQRNVLQFLLSQLCPQIEALKEARLVRWSIDVDPQDMT